LRESPKRFAKDRMRLHELSRLSETVNHFFHTKKRGEEKENNIKITKREKNVMNIAPFFITFPLLHTKPAFTSF